MTQPHAPQSLVGRVATEFPSREAISDSDGD